MKQIDHQQLEELNQLAKDCEYNATLPRRGLIESYTIDEMRKALEKASSTAHRLYREIHTRKTDD
jgi:hypothetical protein